MIVGNRQLTEEQTQIRRHFVDFLEADRLEEKYTRRINRMMAERKNRLIVDMGDLLDFIPPSAEAPQPLGLDVIHEPSKYIPLFEIAVHDKVLHHHPDYFKVNYRSRGVHIGFEGPVGRVLGPRELYARHLNTLVALEGIVTRQSALRPRLLETVHYCPETNKFSRKEYRDQLTPMLDSSHLPTVNVMPKTDMEGNALRTELGLSSFIDSQCAMLQEAPERAPTGQLPRSVELRFDDDLVDVVKPGDRVVLVGTYASYTTSDSKQFQTIVLVNNVISQGAAAQVPRLLESHVTEIKKFAERFNRPGAVLDELSRSIAPAIYGLADEKKAILLMLVGGVERRAHNSHIRGDINVLLVGEPSTAKSQLLRFVLGIAPLAINTTGKGSSGVGLTAAVTVDAYSGERSLSAGAMVLADRGIICIDEFDKMSPQDRVSMHEAMEQQTVTIAKAGIHASLNARCSVLAAANPVYGFYSVKHRLSFNVGLPESLLSRFDLTFIILDQHSSDHNRRIGAHILRNHMNSVPVPFDTVVTKTVVEREGIAADDGDGAQVGGTSGATASKDALSRRPCVDSSGRPIVSATFLRHYIEYARSITPMLTEGSQLMISQHYVQLRSEQHEAQSKDSFFITARTLESIIRLATAHARLRLSSIIEELDVEVAMALLRSSVHAASAAAVARQKDKEALRADKENGGPRAKAPRREATGIAAAAGATQDAPTLTFAEATQEAAQLRAVEGAVASFKAQHRTEVHLHEIRERLQAQGHDVDLPVLQRSLTQLTSDEYALHSTEQENILYFTS